VIETFSKVIEHPSIKSILNFIYLIMI